MQNQPRASMGELIQIDGSEHGWFEGRGPPCTLLAFVDDATSRIMHARFVATESIFDYFRATRAYLERYGKPVAFYSDKHAIFRVNSKEAQGGDGMTQFGRALDELTIEIICDDLGGRVRRPGRWTQAGGGDATRPAGGSERAGAIGHPWRSRGRLAVGQQEPTPPRSRADRARLRRRPEAGRPTAAPARLQPAGQPQDPRGHKPPRPRRPVRINQRAGESYPGRRPPGDLGRHEEERARRSLQERRPRAAPQGPPRSGSGARFRPPRA